MKLIHRHEAGKKFNPKIRSCFVCRGKMVTWDLVQSVPVPPALPYSPSSSRFIVSADILEFPRSPEKSSVNISGGKWWGTSLEFVEFCVWRWIYVFSVPRSLPFPCGPELSWASFMTFFFPMWYFGILFTFLRIFRGVFSQPSEGNTVFWKYI